MQRDLIRFHGFLLEPWDERERTKEKNGITMFVWIHRYTPNSDSWLVAMRGAERKCEFAIRINRTRNRISTKVRGSPADSAEPIDKTNRRVNNRGSRQRARRRWLWDMSKAQRCALIEGFVRRLLRARSHAHMQRRRHRRAHFFRRIAVWRGRSRGAFPTAPR